MKRPARALQLVSGLEGVGRRIHIAVATYLTEHPTAIGAVHDLVSCEKKGELPIECVGRVRIIRAEVVGATDVSPVDTGALAAPASSGVQYTETSRQSTPLAAAAPAHGCRFARVPRHPAPVFPIFRVRSRSGIKPCTFCEYR